MNVLATADGTAARLELAGELDLATAPALEAAVSRALDEGRREVVIDLSRTTLLDSAGLAALIRAARSVSRCRGRMTVHSPPGSEARVVIQVSGTGRLLGLADP